MKQMHILELLEWSPVYDDPSNTNVHQTKVMENVSLVHYSYDGNTFIDVWNCNNGMVLVYPDLEPNKRYMKGDMRFNILHSLLINS